MLVVVVAVYVLATWPTNRAVKTWRSPDRLVYDGNGPYYLSVVEGKRDLSGILFFSAKRRYRLYAGRESGDPSYGHWLDISFYPDVDEDVEAHIRRSRARWSADGVRFFSASGHEVFVPASMFTGGR